MGCAATFTPTLVRSLFIQCVCGHVVQKPHLPVPPDICCGLARAYVSPAHSPAFPLFPIHEQRNWCNICI